MKIRERQRQSEIRKKEAKRRLQSDEASMCVCVRVCVREYL